MQRVCLNMIVKNEAHVIRRCLASVRPFIDSWVIVDTGSTDGTQAIIREFLADLPGELHERPWKNFGHNRTEAIELAREWGDYLFVIDADELLSLPPGFVRPALSGDAYLLEVSFGGIHYGRVCLIDNRLPWRWLGVLHEYLDCGRPVSRPWLPGPTVIVHSDGGRSQISVTEKYRRDAELLEAALVEEPDNARYVFYLAQSYRDSEQPEKALAAYERRAAMGGWDEEVWYALLSCARLAERLGREPPEVSWRYQRAFDARPARPEAPTDLARYLRGQKLFAAARMLAEQALRAPPTADLLFVDRSYAQWRAADEYAVASYWCGDHAATARTCRRLLGSGAVPDSERGRVQANLDFAEQAQGIGIRAPIVPPVLPPLDAPTAPTVMIAILARNKAHVLPQFLRCLERLDYPAARIQLYVRTNDNLDDTEPLLRDWLAANGARYAGIDFEAAAPEPSAAATDGEWHPHDWTPQRLGLLARIREASLRRAQALGCRYYFVIDCDNFIAPWTLRCLIDANRPIVAPMLEALPSQARYSNFFGGVDATGFYQEAPGYDDIRYRRTAGVFEVPVVHCTYLIDAACLPRLAYHDDGPQAMEFVVFSRVARAQGIGQFIDNRHYYGELLHHADGGETLSLRREAELWRPLAAPTLDRVLQST